MTSIDVSAHHDPGRLYFGHVMHVRLKPFRHKFRYRVFSVFVDIDRLAELAARTRIFSYNRVNIMSFHDKDHGYRDGSRLRSWVEDVLKRSGLDCEGGRIELLCYPRMFGYVFNPLSVYYCYDPSGTLRAVIYEVSNTFGEWHAYVAPVRTRNRQTAAVTQRTDKAFYVSPFMPVSGSYRFRITNPGDKISIAVRQTEADEAVLIATFDGVRRRFSDASLLRALVAYPLMTVKVIGAIHWEALKLWFKGARHVEKPPPPVGRVSVGR